VQTLANIVDGNNADKDHQAREYGKPGIFDEVVLCAGDEIV
jgi:hypothetical protein